tara:strand:- start:4403 stop:7738 length:3336 start_codon:yes stop_codon:yes gene_type:complete
MPQLKNIFVRGKMNQDLDERLVPKGEYREGQNILITNSEDSDVGAIENALGNKLAYDVAESWRSDFNNKNAEVIGAYVDVSNNRIFWFVTTFSGLTGKSIINMDRASVANGDICKIIMKEGSNAPVVLVNGPFLNFSKNHLITGINSIDNYLFFTDNYNQPRGIDVDLAKENPSYYNCEEKISVAKVAPYQAPFLTNTSGAGDGTTLLTTNPSDPNGIKSDYLKDRFVRFGYRYKYEDNQYSIISPFTQVVFKPLNNGSLAYNANQTNSTTNEAKVSTSVRTVAEKTIVDIMENAYDKITMRIPLPNVDEFATSDPGTTYSNDLKLKSIEIVLKESDGISIKIVDVINIAEKQLETSSPFKSYSITPVSGTTYYRQTIDYIYKSEKPFKTLPERQTIRVSDKIPVRSKSQELVSNRLIYGNLTLGYDLPTDEDGRKGINFLLNSQVKGANETNATTGLLQYNKNAYKYHNIKQRRTYQAGVVLSDRFGRQSPVILSTNTDSELTDTHTVDAVNTNFHEHGPNNSYSWSQSEAGVVGKALNIEFKDTRLVEAVKAYATDNPNGWFSWKLVVKQTEQDYYNVYGFSPGNSWSTEGTTSTTLSGDVQIISGSIDTTTKGKSWFTLYGDNINKIPRSLNKDTDINREGVTSSDVKLFPKVVGDAGAISEKSKNVGDIRQEYIDVLSIGSAIDQGLASQANIKNYFESRLRPYGFLFNSNSNPQVAELPNLFTELAAPSSAQNVSINPSNSGTFPFGYPHVNNSNLTVFETKPFESKIDIFYETSTSGLVNDLNLLMNNTTGAPSDIRIDGNTSDSFFESAASGTTIGVLSATPSGGQTISTFQILGISNGTNQNGRFTAVLDSGTWYLKTNDTFLFKNNSEDVFVVTVKAIQGNGTYVTQDITINLTNTAPSATSVSATVASTTSNGTFIVYVPAVNGSARTTNNDNKSGLSGALSQGLGGNNSGMFTLTQSPNGRFVLTANNTFNYSSFFGQNLTSKSLTLTVTDNGGLTGTATIILNPSTSNGLQGWAHGGATTACTMFCDNMSTTYYGIQGSGTGVPSDQNGVYTGNIIYIDATLQNRLMAGSSGYFVDANGAQFEINNGVIGSGYQICPQC